MKLCEECGGELRAGSRFCSIACAKAGNKRLGQQRAEEIFRLHAVEGLSLTEIGRRLGVSRQRAQQLARRGGAPQSEAVSEG